MAAIIRGHGAADDCDDDDEEEGEKRALLPLFEGILVLLLMILMRRSTMINGYGKPLRVKWKPPSGHQEDNKQSPGKEKTETVRCSLSFSSSSTYLIRVT